MLVDAVVGPRGVFFEAHGLSVKAGERMQPFLRYQGGKTRLADRIVALMPEHRVYVESFFGGGSVFFAKPRAEVEVVSDADRDLMGVYRALQEGSFRCDMTPNKERFGRVVAKARKGDAMTPCEYVYRNKISFGGKGGTVDPGAFKKCVGEKAKTCGISSKKPEKYRERLKGVRISVGDYAAVSLKHDAADALHYWDPPYAGTSTEGYRHGRSLGPEDVRKAADGLKGKLILSYNDTPRVRGQFCSAEAKGRGYRCRTVETEYTINNVGRHDKRTELLITKGIS